MMEDGVDINPDEEDDEEIEMKQKMSDAIDHIKTLTNYDEQYDYMMQDEDLNSILHSIAENMCQTVYFHDDEEMVIFMGEITNEDDEELADDGTVKNVVSDDKKMLN